MTNLQLLETIYVHTHQAGDLISDLYLRPSTDSSVFRTIRDHLRAAHCAALELTHRAEGNPPKNEEK